MCILSLLSFLSLFSRHSEIDFWLRSEHTEVQHYIPAGWFNRDWTPLPKTHTDGGGVVLPSRVSECCFHARIVTRVTGTRWVTPLAAARKSNAKKIFFSIPDCESNRSERLEWNDRTAVENDIKKGVWKFMSENDSTDWYSKPTRSGLCLERLLRKHCCSIALALIEKMEMTFSKL